MVFKSIMGEIKNFCNDEDGCVLIILVLVGFLLCMYFNKNEGFDFGNFDNSKEEPDIGRKPTNNGKRVEPQVVGLKPVQNDPINGFGSLDDSIKQLRKEGDSGSPSGIGNDPSLKQIDYSFPEGALNGKSGGYYPFQKLMTNDNSMMISNWGPDKPLKDTPPSTEMMKVSSNGEGGIQADNTAAAPSGTSQKIELVLFYAPWCGHSVKMLDDYDQVISEYNGKEEGGIKYEVKKIDMDKNPKAAKETYGVEVKGFPTLYTFYKVGDKKISKEFNFRTKSEIIEELKKRGKQI